MGLFVFIQSSLLFFLAYNHKFSVLLRKIIFLSLPFIVGVFVLTTGIYKETFNLSGFEKNQLWERRELYRRDLGIFGRSNFSNTVIEKTKLVNDKLITKIAQPFDLSRYFSVDPSTFYYLVFFPFFVLGFLVLLSEKLGLVLYYLGLGTLGAIFVQPGLAYWLFVPLINLGILFGVINFKKIFRKINE